MSIVGYSTCIIQFIRNGTDTPEREYSERSIVELRQLDYTAYSIRAIDVENNRTEIFNIPLKARDQYKFGESEDQPDEIEDSNGVYCLWFDEDLRSQIHETFCAIYEVVFPEEVSTKSPERVSTTSSERVPTTSSERVPTTSSGHATTSYTSKKVDEQRKPVTPDPVHCDPKDILIDVRNLSKFIKQGKDDEAAQLARELATHGVRLQAKPLKKSQKEEEFRILVQIDGNEYSTSQNGGRIPVNVFPSTTIRELRAAFEIAYHYSPTNQYFFVNGNLVQDDSTMKELNVGPNSLFVLFIIAYPKQFKTNGPWFCSACSNQNPQDRLKCSLCTASRME